VQLDKVLYKWFTAMRSKRKPCDWPMIIEKVKSFYHEVKSTDRCAFSEDSNKRTASKNPGQYRYCLIIWDLSRDVS
jgi:hypothetical protein